MVVAIAGRMATNGDKLGDGQHDMGPPLPGKIYFLFYFFSILVFTKDVTIFVKKYQ